MIDVELYKNKNDYLKTIEKLKLKRFFELKYH